MQIMFDLSEKKALVTGASGGIGGAVVSALHRKGATVALSGTRREKLDELVSQLGERAHALPCNLRDREEVRALPGRAEEAMDGLDILVSNAGITRDNIFLRLKDEDWDDLLEVNLTAYFQLARAALRGMMRRRWGRIIGITSVVGVIGNAGQANYAAAKAGMIGMTKSLAQEVASRKITVNCIAPGMIETAMTEALSDDQRDRLLQAIPAGRFGTGTEVAGGVVFLASEEASYITGQTIHVNGGMAMI